MQTGKHPTIGLALKVSSVLIISALVLSCAKNNRRTYGDAGERSEPPPFIVHSVCAPSFDTASGTLSAGTAFVLRAPSKGKRSEVLVTAHHLFGPAGGLQQNITWTDLPSFVRSVRCESLENSTKVLRAGRALRIVGAHAYSEPGEALDVAAFTMASGSSDGLDLASSRPNVGQQIWLLARVVSGESFTKLLHPARVVSIDDQWVRFEYQNARLTLQATSGAPIVDVDGRVVAINIGGISNAGRLVGIGLSASIVQRAIVGALADAR